MAGGMQTLTIIGCPKFLRGHMIIIDLCSIRFAAVHIEFEI